VDKSMDRPTAREIETERIMKGGSDWRYGGPVGCPRTCHGVSHTP
jgi:hypothetical protein